MADIEVEGSDLAATVADEIRQAQTFDQTKRTLAIEYMRGEMNDVPARVNGSSQTSRDVADTLSWILPGVVRVFTASDQMVEYEATQEGGEQGAEEATEYTNYSFFRENDGYRILYNATYDSLLMGNGAVCSYWCPEEAKTKLFKDKTEEELALLLEDGWQGMGVAPKPGKPQAGQIEDLMTGELVDVEVPTFTVRLQMITERGQIKDMTCKPENLLLNNYATTIEDARFCAYLHDDKTRSDLMAMADEYGWDKAEIENIPAYSRRDSTEVSDARRSVSETLNDDSPIKSGDIIDLYECYIKADQDGDGIAELLQVWYAGNAGSGLVLSSDEWEDDVPFTDIPCYPVPHRWEAESVYDRTADIQRVKTALLRQMIDNAYAVGLPMREVEEGSVINPDILVNPKFGGLIWKKKSSPQIINYETDFIGDKLMMGLTYMDELIAKRTGVSKSTMALDPEALQNQTATASQNQRDAGYSQIELIARNMAELGWSKFFSKRRNLAKKYIKGEVKIPSRSGEGGYRGVQPEAWGDDMACTINVGLGTGSRDRDMAMMNVVVNGQLGMVDRLVNFGMKSKAIEFIPKIRKAAVQMAESSGLKNPEDYYPDFTEDEVKAAIAEAMKPQPDPAVQLEEMKGQVTLKVEEGKNLLAMKQAEMDSAAAVRREQAQLEADLMTKQADRENEAALEQQRINADMVKQERELAFKAVELQTKTELEREKMANAVKVAAARPKPQPGASTGAAK